MRALFALAIVGFGIASVVPASAGYRHHRHHHHYAPVAVRAGQIVVYDFEPGVVVRAYWSRPWRGRHYFPTLHKIDITARGEAGEAEPGYVARPAESFEREWSTSSGLIDQQMRMSEPPQTPEPLPPLPKSQMPLK
ncbi:MAG TPA: hypothetical protein VHD14_13165 [Pseudolabrys sp.]|nr:hypothetical protein [Pseudolabrys sp.]